MVLIKITVIGFLFLILGLSIVITSKNKKKQKKLDSVYKNHIFRYRNKQ
jgi:uncharacterized membrane protein